MAEGDAGLPELTEDQARAWAKAEDVAVHFNELIMNFRLKAVGALTLAAGLVGTVLLNKGDSPPPQINYYSFALAMWFLAIVWVAILCLDLFYYHRLLLGAVEEAIRIEKVLGERCQLSTLIKRSAEEGPRDSVARGAFYLLPLTVMVVAGGVAWCYAPPPSAPRTAAAATAAPCVTCPSQAPAGPVQAKPTGATDGH